MFQNESLRRYQHALPPRYLVLLDSLMTNEQIPFGRIKQYAELSQQPDLIESIHDELNALNRYRIRPGQPVHPKVRTGWNILREFFEPKHDELAHRGIVPMVYGSLVYNDPVNADFDVLLVGPDFDHQIHRQINVVWNNELLKQWPFNHQGHMTDLSLLKLRLYASLIQDNTYLDDIRKYSTDIFTIGDDVSIVLSGLPIFEEDNPHLEQLRRSFLPLLTAEPLLAAFVLSALRETRAVRVHRRQ